MGLFVIAHPVVVFVAGFAQVVGGVPGFYNFPAAVTAQDRRGEDEEALLNSRVPEGSSDQGISRAQLLVVADVLDGNNGPIFQSYRWLVFTFRFHA